MKVNITVEGKCGSGKTIIAYLVKHFLSKYFKVTIYDTLTTKNKSEKAYKEFEKGFSKMTFGGRDINLYIKHEEL
jgi:CO dehydrogenase nickel-insertion accessory protein CooC1